MASTSSSSDSSISIKVKWGKETFTLDVNPMEGIITLKAQLMALTAVPLERQKILSKGKQLKEDIDLAKLKNGEMLMMMGTSDVLQESASKPVLFEEDMTEAQRSKLAVNVLPSGLVNLGNTCYMNSSLQCLRSFPELKTALSKYKVPANDRDQASSLVTGMNALFNQMDKCTSDSPVQPTVFTYLFREVYPQFAERTNQGHYMQQDADECFSQLMQLLLNKLKGVVVNQNNDTFESLFQGEMVQTTKCSETDLEPVQNSRETFRKLACHITSNTNHLLDGITDSMTSKVEKHSSILSRNAIFTTTSKLSKLPKYLSFQFVRFDWKRLENVKSKIMRKVIFPPNLDMFEYCEESLQKRLKENRILKLKQEEEKLGMKSLALPSTSSSMEVENKNDAPPTKETAKYELVALVTHQGRSADSGHYIGWARSEKDHTKWTKFDDATVTQVTEEDVKSLTGGGDWHMGYLCFYKHVMDD